jgi:hypothetical protein
MNDSEFLQDICEGYVQCYRTQNLGVWSSWTDLTRRGLEFFSRLGEMLGFFAVREGDTNDLSWYDDPHKTNLVLHLEHENKAKRALSEALRRLLQPSRARFLVAVLADELREPDIEEIKQRICTQVGDRFIAVIAFTGGRDKGLPTERFDLRALVCGQSKLRTRRGLMKVDEKRYWYAYFEEEWKEEPLS